MANEFVQTMADARVDAQSLSDFVFKPSGFKVARRLAPTVDTLQFYINRFNSLNGDFSSSVSVALSSLNSSVAEADGKVAYIETTVQDAINNTAVEGGVLADTFVTMTANSAGSVPRNLRDVNSDTTNLLNFIPTSEMVAIQNRTSTYDCSAALAAAVATGKRVIIPTAGTYKFIAGYSGTTDFDVVATTSGVVFDLNDVTKSTSIENTGSLTKLLTKSNPEIKKGSRSITSVITGLSEGDWVCFDDDADYSYSTFKPSYKGGEWKQVAAITSTKTIFTQPFYEDYSANTLDVYKLNSVKCAIENIKLVQKNKKAGVIMFSLSSDAHDKDIVFDCSTSAVITYARCVGHKSYNPQGINLGITVGTNTGLEYGIVVANTQHGRVFGGNIYSQRHAVATGGSTAVCNVPVTDFRCYDAVLTNEEGINTGCADMHANTRHSSYEGCSIYGGTKIAGGDECYFIDCDIFTDTTGEAGTLVRSMGGRSGWINCNVIARGSPQSNSGAAPFSLGASTTAFHSDVKKPVHMVLTGITYTNPDIVTEAYETFCKVTNSGSTHKINIELDDITINTPVKMQNLLLIKSDAGSDSSDFIICDNIKGSVPVNLVSSPQASYINSPLRLPKVSILDKLTTVSAIFSRTAAKNLPYTFPRSPVINTSVRKTGATLGTSKLGLAGQLDYDIETVQANLGKVQSQIIASAAFTAGVDVLLSTTLEIREC